MNLKFIVVSLSLIFAIISNGLETIQKENVINENISNEQTQNIIQIEEVYEDEEAGLPSGIEQRPRCIYRGRHICSDWRIYVGCRV